MFSIVPATNSFHIAPATPNKDTVLELTQHNYYMAYCATKADRTLSGVTGTWTSIGTSNPFDTKAMPHTVADFKDVDDEDTGLMLPVRPPSWLYNNYKLSKDAVKTAGKGSVPLNAVGYDLTTANGPLNTELGEENATNVSKYLKTLRTGFKANNSIAKVRGSLRFDACAGNTVKLELPRQVKDKDKEPAYHGYVYGVRMDIKQHAARLFTTLYIRNVISINAVKSEQNLYNVSGMELLPMETQNETA